MAKVKKEKATKGGANGGFSYGSLFTIVLLLLVIVGVVYAIYKYVFSSPTPMPSNQEQADLLVFNSYCVDGSNVLTGMPCKMLPFAYSGPQCIDGYNVFSGYECGAQLDRAAEIVAQQIQGRGVAIIQAN